MMKRSAILDLTPTHTKQTFHVPKHPLHYDCQHTDLLTFITHSEMPKAQHVLRKTQTQSTKQAPVIEMKQWLLLFLPCACNISISSAEHLHF